MLNVGVLDLKVFIKIQENRQSPDVTTRSYGNVINVRVNIDIHEQYAYDCFEYEWLQVYDR